MIIDYSHPAWRAALSLTERLERASVHHYNTPAEPSTRARQKLAHWRQQKPFVQDDIFSQRLDQDGLDEATLLGLLDESPQAGTAHFAHLPDWLVEIQAAYTHYPFSHDQALPLPAHLQSQAIAGFLKPFEPLLRHGYARLHESMHTLATSFADMPFDAVMVSDILFRSLLPRLLAQINRTLVLELHVARLRGELHGDSAEARFRDFIAQLGNPITVQALMLEYPALFRQVEVLIHNRVTAYTEFLTRLCEDWTIIREKLCPNQHPGMLVHIDADAGDMHQGGRSVMIATFASGFKLVYKPRSLAVDQHMQELLAQLNEWGFSPRLQMLTVLDHNSYGWAEFATPHPCANTMEVERFYERLGAYLALLYTLEATDFHFENVLACGEHPMLIDLESLFHPILNEPFSDLANAQAQAQLVCSVLRVGLLPQRVWSKDNPEGIDLSAMGAQKGQLLPFDAPDWEKTGTDAMQFVRKRVTLPGSQNRPTLHGVDVRAEVYHEAIVAGFTHMYNLLIAHRDALLAPDGPIARFANDEVRVIVRPSRFYGQLLQESFHPDLLRDALDRDRHFDFLWSGVQRKPILPRLIPAERTDVLRGDIPLFVTQSNSCDLWTSTRVCIPEVFRESGLARVECQLRQLNNADLAQQTWIIRAALATSVDAREQFNPSPLSLLEASATVTHDRLVQTIRTIGDRLEQLAFRGQDDVAWLGVSLMQGKHWRLSSVGMDFYDGLPGIAFFLAYLGSVIGQEYYTALVRDVLHATRRNIRYAPPTAIGAFNGWGGLIYLFTHISELWSDVTFLDDAVSMSEQLAMHIDRDESLDIIGGAAGAIAALLSLHHIRPSEEVLAVAKRCGDHLLAHAVITENGIGWPSSMARMPLTGFAHGAAGIAWSLHLLAKATGETRFTRAAQAAVMYERSQFVAEVGNWRDLRDSELTGRQNHAENESFMTAWCHGATGIGLARLQMFEDTGDLQLRAEVMTAVQTTLIHGLGANDSLCHGDLGNIELLLRAGVVFDRPDWREQASNYVAMLLDAIPTRGWRCGVPVGAETPGLMTGLAGMGYGLLRLAKPDHIPSVLLLEPPTRRIL